MLSPDDRVSPIADKAGAIVAYNFRCPGCTTLHVIHVSHPTADTWTFNGDLKRPTFSPSILVNADRSHPGLPRCHSFVRDGCIQFLGDCTHDLAGRTVELPSEGVE